MEASEIAQRVHYLERLPVVDRPKEIKGVGR
jgi:hypothetical protein